MNPAMMNIPCVKVTRPMIIGPKKPPNEEMVLTIAIPAGAVDSVKKSVKNA